MSSPVASLVLEGTRDPLLDQGFPFSPPYVPAAQDVPPPPPSHPALSAAHPATGVWETHLSNAFLNGLSTAASTAVRATYIGVMDGARLEEARRHAESRLSEEKANNDKKRRDRKEKAQLTMVGHTNPKATTVAEEGTEAEVVSEAEAEDAVAKEKTPKVDETEATKPTKKQGKMEAVSSADPKTTGSMTVQKPHGTRTGEITARGNFRLTCGGGGEEGPVETTTVTDHCLMEERRRREINKELPLTACHPPAVMAFNTQQMPAEKEITA
ncbi:hypothetical protein F7725_017515 [Dissostichus mawsoni]|uniref:Uncharacterized protein n=1 Tax=Dissostichus mawsoni TaxID=36200 RepID=A0A7J5Z4N2_DISMA|nr:hypothetical protein F7725_017515 [Dissostichus mawsoni]